MRYACPAAAAPYAEGTGLPWDVPVSDAVAAIAGVGGIALDVALIHIASMSNLAAALGWALVDLLEHPWLKYRRVWQEPVAGQRTRTNWNNTKMSSKIK